MGSSIFWGSREARRADHDTTDMLKSLAKELRMALADLEELHYIFLAQHPDGVITRAQFITDNIAAHGGCEALWDRVFDFAALNATDDDSRLVDGRRPHPPHLTFKQVMVSSSQGRRRRATVTFERLVQRVFQFTDIHDDGFLDENELRTVIEWLYALQETVNLRLSNEVLHKFCGHATSRSTSSTGSGTTVTMSSLEHLYPPLVHPSERAAQILRWMDLDQDGVICESEFIEACRGDQSFVEAFSFLT